MGVMGGVAWTPRRAGWVRGRGGLVLTWVRCECFWWGLGYWGG